MLRLWRRSSLMPHVPEHHPDQNKALLMDTALSFSSQTLPVRFPVGTSVLDLTGDLSDVLKLRWKRLLSRCSLYIVPFFFFSFDSYVCSFKPVPLHLDQANGSKLKSSRVLPWFFKFNILVVISCIFFPQL